MTQMRKFSRSIRQFLRDNKDEEIPGRLGDLSGTVKADDFGNVYVTVFGGITLTVYNGKVPNATRLHVVIGYGGGDKLQVLRSRDVFVSPLYPDIAAHASMHTFPGPDTIPVRAEQIVPGLVVPVTGLTVRVYATPYQLSDGWHILPTQDVDLLSSVPASGAIFGLLEADDAGVVQITLGAAVDQRSALEYSNIPGATPGRCPIAAVKLYAGQTVVLQTILDSDIIDLRFGRLGGAPGGNDTNIQFNDGGAFGGEDTFIRQANGAIVIGDIDPALAIEAYSLGQGADGTSIANFLETFGTGVASYIALLRARGTHDAPTAIMEDDVIGRIRGRGHDGTGWTPTRAEIRIVADKDWSAGDHPTRIELWTCPDDSDVLTLAMTIGSDGSITLPQYGDGSKTGTATYGLGVDVDGNVIETTASGTNIPIVASDPVSPTDGELWLLRETTGAIADGVPIGLLLALTYTDNTGSTAPLQLSVWDDVTSQIIRY